MQEVQVREEAGIKVFLANPRGFCAGVNRAITLVHQALERYHAPVYVLHEIVHNTSVIDELRRRGVVFVEYLEEIPRGAITIFSAHGVSLAVERQAEALGLRTIDATCPLVAAVHRRLIRLNAQGFDVLVIGHKGHPEVEGTCGQVEEGAVHVVSTVAEINRVQVADPTKVGYVTQTTLSVHDTRELMHAIRARFPAIAEPERTDICYATTNRQSAVRQLADQVDMVLVVGSKNSSNSNRLREVAEQRSTPAYLIDHADEIDPAWLVDVRRIGITAGASAPEHLVMGVVDWLRAHGAVSVEEMPGSEECIRFAVPDQLV
ncbi:MAG: 4-hydroxy-3-methylbut-2-enyl diphosphate reductase [Desulfobulbus sp.]|jgi:4-hydroxy-3-methylbut-2-enyl diphosphate reductase